ncbi:MAG: hypothetical protein AAGF11_22480 [Myxococcota bacterium]
MRKVEFTLLCEDQQHATFLRRYLRRQGFNFRQFRILPCPAGSQSGEQWVRQSFPKEVRAQRRRATHSRTASLLVMIDADGHEEGFRHEQFDGALEASGQGARGDEERIAILVPRRNIESWLHFTTRGEIDEVVDFKVRYRGDADACREAAKHAVEICRSRREGGEGASSPAPPSLLRACRELRRVTEVPKG